MDYEALIHSALDCGATKAAVIDQSRIVLSDTFRKICETNQCGGYGRCWMCPPFIGEIHTLMAKVRTFSHAVLYQTIREIEDSYDIEGMFAAGAEHARISLAIGRRLDEMLPGETLNLTCGGCHLCEKCARLENLPCRFPDRALSSLEGYGVDVYNTTKDTPLKYINGPDTVTYFGMVLFTE